MKSAGQLVNDHVLTRECRQWVVKSMYHLPTNSCRHSPSALHQSSWPTPNHASIEHIHNCTELSLMQHSRVVPSKYCGENLSIPPIIASVPQTCLDTKCGGVA